MKFKILKYDLQLSHLRTCVLVSFVVLSSCGGSSSTTTLKNELPSPVAEDIQNSSLVPAPAGEEPAPASELASLPIITVKQRQLADPNVLLNLNATVTAATGASIVATLWTQVTGPTVRIPSPLQLNNEIIIPDVAAATTLEFRLTAQDSNGKINSATLAILVKPLSTFVKVIGGVFNEADKVALFNLRLNETSNLPITFSYSTQDGSANNGSDYTFTSGQITFAAGEISKTISVPLLDDPLNEADETFAVQVLAMDGDIAHNARGTAIIHSDSEAIMPQTIRFSTAAPGPIRVNTQYANPVTASSGTGALIYTSSNLQIATVNANGIVTALTTGTVTITATKVGDASYSSAEASYQLQIVTRIGSAPVVTIDEMSMSLAKGATLNIHASAVDAEDGQLSDDASNQSRIWRSTRTGLLGYGADLAFSSSTWGLHTISHTAIDSDGNGNSAAIDLFVGNLATQASATETASATSCNYVAIAINDSNRSSGFSPNCSGESFIYLRWPTQITFDTIEIYLATPQASDKFIIEYFASNRESWLELPHSDQITPLSWVFSFGAQGVTTNYLRIRPTVAGTLGEIAVYRAFDGTPAETPSTSSSVASVSSASSTIAFSSKTSSSLSSSSLSSAAKASSSSSSSAKASSAISSSSKASSSPSSSSKASSSLVSSSRSSSSKSSASKTSSSKASSSQDVIIII